RTSYLVDEPVVGRFRNAVERLQREHPEAALLCTGPWPAYSFVSGVSG
ncbi:MAG: Gas vesicle synthesis protein GvpL/GvpF, partial [Baekduia sp.]|nr:Gas vesicle synthesis protein GvpL/GvpF [Baekduia sp.]